MATISGKNTTIVETRLGRISENMIRSGPAPCARAASTNSFSRSASTWPRSGRAMYGTWTTAMIRIGISFESPAISSGPIFKPPSASAVPSASPSSSGGKAHRMSSPREMSVSAQPRKKPAIVPKRIDRMIVPSAAPPPISSDVRPPYSSRTAMSRPLPSAPRKKRPCHVGPIGTPSGATTSFSSPPTSTCSVRWFLNGSLCAT